MLRTRHLLQYTTRGSCMRLYTMDLAQKFMSKPNSETAMELLESGGYEKESKKIYNKLLSSNITPSSFVVARVLRNLCHQKAYQDVINVWKDVSKYKLEVTPGALLNFSIAVSESRDMETANTMYNAAIEQNWTAPKFFENIILANLHQHNVRQALLVLHDALQKDVPIRTYIFSQVITTCTRKNAKNEAMAVFDLMVERNIPLNDYIVDDLLTICTEKLDKRGDDVINYFRGTPYSAKVFNLALLYHAKMKQIPQLIECLKQAKQKNVLLRVFIISSIVEACLYKESLEGGKLIQEYIFANPNLEHRIYPLNGLVQLYCNCGEIETAIHLVKMFKKLSIEPVEFTYTTILSAVTVKDVQCGRWVHEQLKKTKMYESAQVRSKIIQMYANCGEINTAVNLFKEMVADNIEIDDYAYSLMLGICVDHKLLDFGEFVCQTIQATKHAPDSNTLKKMEVFLQLWRTTKEIKE